MANSVNMHTSGIQKFLQLGYKKNISNANYGLFFNTVTALFNAFVTLFC